MKCQEAQGLLVAYTRGELEAAEKADLEGHLRGCGDCSKELEDARRVLAITQLANDESTIKTASEIVSAAIERRASDIHIEAEYRDRVRVRFRIDGVLHEYRPDSPLEKEQGRPLVDRFKLMAERNVREIDAPQDGRIPVATRDGKLFELRVSFVPNINGESVVMRILDRSNVLIGLDRLGFSAEVLERLRAMIGQPSGLIIVTGPAGSGTTTTLYSLLQELARTELKVITIENLVEFDLPGIVQIQPDEKAGVTIAGALRSVQRQDPDVLMLGEIRDAETLAIAVESALWGHLVLIAMHSPNAPYALVRLVDVGIPPFSIASAVSGVLAQRLVRTICPDCKQSYEPSHAVLTGLEIAEPGVVFYHGAGCAACGGSGYKGRTIVHELLIVNDAIRELLTRRAKLSEVRAAALAAGMITLREEALRLAREGITTIEEVARVVAGTGYPMSGGPAFE